VSSIVDRCAHNGYVAPCRREPASFNPYPAATVGGTAWAFGWNVASLLPLMLRRLVRVVFL
jgi:hypothetical protein